MKKFIAVLIFVVGALIAIDLLSAEILSRLISAQTGTHSSIGHIAFRNDIIILRNLKIGSPPQGHLPTAFSAKEIRLDAPFLNYLKKTVDIRSIEVNDVYIGIEFYDDDRKHGNWTEIMGDLASDPKIKSRLPRKALITELAFNDLEIEVLLYGWEHSRKLKPIPHLLFHNLDTEDGRITQEITQIVIRKLMGHLFLLKSVQDVLSVPTTILKGLFSPFTGSSNSP